MAQVLTSALIVLLALLCYIYLSIHASTSTRPYTSSADMAWFSGGATNAALVNNLFKNGLINSERVKNAMLAVCAPRPTVGPCFLPSVIIQLLGQLLLYPMSLIACVLVTRSTAHISLLVQPMKTPPSQSASPPPSPLPTCTLQPLNLSCPISTHLHESSISVVAPDILAWYLHT